MRPAVALAFTFVLVPWALLGCGSDGGEAVDPADYYFRIAIRFETSDPELAWLNRVLAVGVGQRPPAGPTYDVYVVR